MSMVSSGDPSGFLAGVRVLELADELGEYCGKVLAGMGADVVKVEPPGGEVTRSYGPFVHDEPHPDRSLYFWHYNFGKRGIMLDLDSRTGQDSFRDLARHADVVLDTRPPGYLTERSLGDLTATNPALIHARISPFGDDGPWAGYQGSDLIHLALGGVVMNCGYDPDPTTGCYETPPVAPQMWQAYHIAGEMTAMAILAALIYQARTGRGQRLSTSVHQAVSANTESDIPDWIFQRLVHQRQTGRHSMPTVSLPALAHTLDGRWLLPYRTYLPSFGDTFGATATLLKRFGLEADLEDERFSDPAVRFSEPVNRYANSIVDSLVGRVPYARDLWRDAQAVGLTWAPVRKPEENAHDEHWRQRGSYTEVYHDEIDETVTAVGAKWYSPDVPWRQGPRAPRLDEHTAEVLAEPRPKRPTPADESAGQLRQPLTGIRVLDLAWLLASAGSGRFLAALGAEVIKVEHESRWDAMRFGSAMAPAGGRAEREAATGPITVPPDADPNRSGMFMEINAGKLGVSLNLKHPRGKEILTQLIRESDVLVEGYSPGTLERMGFGYERLREINPDIIYVQQSGMGQQGIYGRLRSYGPTAQAFTGLTDMSGLPEPYPPAGIGYSYLDWFGAYNMANAVLAAIHRRQATGEGCWIDCSQAETGLYLTGTAVLDHGVNGRTWQRYGNRSPYKPAAPHGVFRTAGEDRWIAIGCFTEDQWAALAGILGLPGDRFATLTDRMSRQEELETLVEQVTRERDGYALMHDLQAAGVPAGVCQTTEDRCDHDPQLAHLHWLTELDQADIGRWPVRDLPFTLDETPARIGGQLDRSGPSYGQDTDYVLGKILGFDQHTLDDLRAAGVI